MTPPAGRAASWAASTTSSIAVIAEYQTFGGRDHTTVMDADRKIRSLMAERMSVYNLDCTP